MTARALSARPGGGATLLTLLLTLHVVWLEGCVSYRPKAIDEVPFQDRALTDRDGGVRVTTAALGRDEAQQLFGVNVGRRGVQPVWLEIENGEEGPVVFFQQSVDPAYFAPSEVAYKNHFSATKRFLSYGVIGLVLWPLLLVAPVQAISASFANQRMDELFVERGIGNHSIAPGDRVEGFVFTHLDEGTKEVRVGLLAPGAEKSFTLFVNVPGLRVDHEKLASASFSKDDFHDVSWPQLRDELVALPCCTTNEKASATGDPLNLVVVGEFEALLEAFTRAGWDETEVIDVGTSWKTAKSFLFSSEYRYSPVSNLYLYGRPQDLAFQKARDTIHERNHLRLWLSPLRYDAKPVWVGQVSRDIGVKLTFKSPTLTTHAIDGQIDDSRENVMGDLLATRRVSRGGYVPGVGPSDPQDPPENLTGDAYSTDGYRAVAVLEREETTVHFFHWEEEPVPGDEEVAAAPDAAADQAN